MDDFFLMAEAAANNASLGSKVSVSPYVGMTVTQVNLMFTKLWLTILLLLHQAGALQSQDGWNSLLSGLTELDGPAFRDQVAEPLVQMSANAYRYPDVIDVPGWRQSSKVAPTAPAEGGVHAIVYEEENGGSDGRIVLAFRGTQIGETIDCDADMCADALLWQSPGGENCTSSDRKCERFDDATLDYFSQALEYTRQTIDAYPSASLLLTGHSLGAGLAILVSAALSTHPTIPVIAFRLGDPVFSHAAECYSAAGTRTALRVRNLTLDAEHQKRIVIIADQWDEIMRTSWDEQLGFVCLYKTPLNAYCKKCFASPSCPFDTVSTRRSMVEVDVENLRSAGDCKRCFLTTHYLAKVINTIEKGNQPACEFIA